MQTLESKAQPASPAHSDCVMEAAAAMLRLTCQVNIRPSTEQEIPATDGVLVAVISLVGDVDWSLFLGLHRETATHLAARFAGFEISFDSDDMGDAVGELTNILAGEVKKLLEGRGVHANISLPNVLRAENIHFLTQKNTHSLKVPLICEVGPLWVGVITVEREAGAA